MFVINEKLTNLENAYSDLDEIRFNELIYENLAADVSVSEALKFASSHYLYFVKMEKSISDDKSIKEISADFNEFKAFMETFSFTILEHVLLLEEKNIEEVISDHYKMYNVAVEIADLEGESLPATKKMVEEIIFADNIARTKLSYEDIEFYLEIVRLKLF